MDKDTAQKILLLAEQGLEIREGDGHAQRLEHALEALEAIKGLASEPPVQEHIQ